MRRSGAENYVVARESPSKLGESQPGAPSAVRAATRLASRARRSRTCRPPGPKFPARARRHDARSRSRPKPAEAPAEANSVARHLRRQRAKAHTPRLRHHKGDRPLDRSSTGLSAMGGRDVISIRPTSPSIFPHAERCPVDPMPEILSRFRDSCDQCWTGSHGAPSYPALRRDVRPFRGSAVVL